MRWAISVKAMFNRQTIIDAYLMPMLRWAKLAIPELFAKFSNIQNYYQEISKDAGVLAALQQEKITP